MNQKISDFLNKKVVRAIALALSFIFPLVILIIIFSTQGYALFSYNGHTVSMIDMQSQYIAFIRYFKNSILTGEGSLIYTSAKAFGGDYASIFTYYLASPFNLFVIFFSNEAIPLFFIWSAIIKMSLASLNFYLLLRFSNHKCKVEYLMFAIGYGLISYSLIYTSNFMWLDGVMVLPLVVLGFSYLRNNNKPWIYIISLAYALLSNWYIGAMICEFAVLYFIFDIFKEKMDGKQRGKYTLRFGICSLIAGLLSSCYWLTAVVHFTGTKASASFPDLYTYPVVMFFRGFLENSYIYTSSITRNTGFMSMFTSIVIVACFLLYFFNKGIKIRKRCSVFTFILVYFLISIVSVLSVLYHGGREPTWFPTRFSFIIGFIVTYFASEEIENIDSTPMYAPIFPALVAAIIIPILTHTENKLLGNWWDMKYTLSYSSLGIYFGFLVLVFAYLFIRFCINDSNKKYIPKIPFILLATILSIISTASGAYTVIKTNANEVQDYSKYLQDDKYTSSVNKLKKLGGNSFYRMEMTFNRPGNYNEVNNNAMFYSYNGVSHYSSSEKRNVQDYMNRIGFHFNGYFEKYEGGSTVAINSFLGIKYLLDDESIDQSTNNKAKFINKYPYTQLTELEDSSSSSIKYYENELALPLAFTMNKSDYTYISQGYKPEGHESVYWYDHFEYQNQMFKSLTDKVVDEHGNKKDIFKKLPVSNTTTSSGLTYTTDEYGFKSYTGSGTATINFTIPTEAINKPLYVCEKDYYDNGTKYYIDGVNYLISTYWHKGIKGFEISNPSGNHALKISITNSVNNKQIREELYYEDTDVLKEYIEVIKEESLYNVVSTKGYCSSGYIGEINLNESNRQLLFTLPYENNIKVFVDGKKVETLNRFDIFTACDLSNYELGKHTIKIIYQDKGLVSASIITILTTAGIITGIVLYFLKKKKTTTK